MKKHIFSLIYFLLIIGTIPIYSQEYFYTDFNKAQKIAKEEDKRLFVDFSATWCGPCRMMEKDIFLDPDVASFLSDKYICVKLMYDKNKLIFKKYHVNRFPTFIIMKNNGMEIYRWSGFTIKEHFLKKFVEFPKEKNLIEKYDSLYSIKKKDIDFLRKYYVVLNENKYYTKSKKISKQILKYDKNWLKKENMMLVLRNIDSHKYHKFLLKNKPIFYDSLSIELVDQNIFLNYMNDNIYMDSRKDYINLKKIKKSFNKLFHSKNVDKYFNNYLFYVLKDKKDIKQKQIYKVAAFKYLQLERNLMNNKVFYQAIQSLIFRIKSLHEFHEMEKAFEFQFAEEPESIYLPYYDLKAFVEYMLQEKEKYINTIKKANEISVKLQGKPFKSKLREIIYTYKIVNKDITQETLN